MLIELLLIGVSCYGAVIALDRFMDYGHALSFVRYWCAFILATKRDKVRLRTAKKNYDFSGRINDMDSLYHKITTYRPYLLLLLCKSCMAFWVVIAVSLCLDLTLLNWFVVFGTAYFASTFDN